MAKIHFLDLTFAELREILLSWGEPKFRAGQVWRWVYHNQIFDPAEMSNLPKELRQRLAQEFQFSLLRPLERIASQDGLTEKVLFETEDAQTVEAVLMRYRERNSVCISSQIGCPIGCPFCATGQSGFVRNLSAGEIAAQVLYFSQILRGERKRVTHVVLMGMGEPLLNFDAVWQAILSLNDPRGFGLGARHFTISTAGVIPGIERLAGEDLEVGLAVSLHAPDDALRDVLVPINKRYPLKDLMTAVRAYIERRGRRVTFEYALIAGVNDAEAQAQQTADLLRGLLCHVNLIPLNPTAGSSWRPSPVEKVRKFQEILEENGVRTTVRLRRGIDIQAGCGQLRHKHLLKEN